MTVAELKKFLETIPDDMEVLVYDEGYATTEVEASIQMFDEKLEWILEHSGHPKDVVGKLYFLIS